MITGQAVLRSWGNSQGIRIPKKILDACDIRKDDVLQIESDSQQIVIKKAFRHKTFEERLAQYDGRIEVMDFDWGEPVGKEIL